MNERAPSERVTLRYTIASAVTLLVVSGCTTGGDLRAARDRREASELRRPATTQPIGRQAAGPSIRRGATEAIEYVLLVSVDGLAPRYIDALTREGDLPTFRSLQRLGSFTHNARTDVTLTVTLPNHISMLTGRPVTAVEGLPATTHHGYTYNAAPAVTDTLHGTANPALDYIASVLDVVHDHGGRTCFFASKNKFILFDQSYNEHTGAPDVTGEDNGRDKIDELLVTDLDTPRLIDAVTRVISRDPCTFTFLHITNTDSPSGHSLGWGSPGWLDVLRTVDDWLGRVVGAMDGSPNIRNRWALVLTADHGGSGTNHQDPADPNHFTVPFYVVGPGVPRNADLYRVVGDTRRDPGTVQPPFVDPHPPIRNGDAGNVALELLGLPYIPGSLMRGLHVVGD